MERQAANRQLVRIISSMVEAYPDLRFSQILGNFDFVQQFKDALPCMAWEDEYHLESKELLKRVTEALSKLNIKE